MQALDGIWADFRAAVRFLRATPLVSTVAAVSLALGIGANTGVFSLFNGLVLRPLPGVISPAQLVTLSAGHSNPNAPRWPYVFWKEIQQRAPAFGGAFAWSTSQFEVSNGSEGERIDGAFVSGDYFATLGVRALIGRTLTETDDTKGGGADGPVVVISYNLWQRRFAASTQVLGTLLIVNSTPFTIVGVLPPEFGGTEVGRAFDIGIPIATEPLIRSNQSWLRPPADRAAYWLTVGFRLKTGQSIEGATALLREMQSQIKDAAQPQVQGRDLEFLTEPFELSSMRSGTSNLRKTYKRPLLAIFLVVSLVLLLACGNITNLQLGRATAREHERGIRRALGASHWRLARPVLIESLLLAGLGACGGLVVALAVTRLLLAQISTASSRIALDVALDWRVLAFTTVVTFAAAMLSGILPAILAGRTSPMGAIKAQARGIAGSHRPLLSGGLVSFQVGLSLVIVIFAELFVGTFQELAGRSLGFDTNRVLLVRVDASHAATSTNRAALYQRLVTAAARTPGVAQAAGSFTTPVSGNRSDAFVHVPGTAVEPAGPHNRSSWNFVTPSWFSTYGTPLRAGRDLDQHDVQGSTPVVLVNELFVRRFFPAGDAIGRTVDLAGGARGELPFGTRMIVGVVGNSIFGNLREEPRPMMYFPLAQWFLPFQMDWSLNIGVRSAGAPPAGLAPGVNAALQQIDHSFRVEFRTLDAQVSDSLNQERAIATLSGCLAGLALLLAALGLYGMTIYNATRRRSEIGIRMALGARQPAIIRLVLTQFATLVGAGIALGTLTSVILSQFVASLLYGIAPQDYRVLIGASFVLLSVATCASGLPAWRASRIDPIKALREG